MSIVLSGSTSGTITLQEPAVAGTNTLNLPAATGTLALTGAAVTRSQLPVGTVLQVVQATTGTDTTVSSTSYTDINLSASITPTTATSKILVLVSISGRYYTRTTGDRKYSTNIVRGATQVHEISTSDLQAGLGAGSFTIHPALSSLNYLDSPATTSATTYKSQVKVNNTADTTSVALNEDSGVSTITLMEIAA